MAGTRGVALVGAGYWGRRLARTVAAAHGCELRVVCDVDASRAHELSTMYGGAPVTSWTAALADDSVEAVVIATPSVTHAELVSAALDAGRHVLVEKPLAGSVEEAAELARSAERRDLVIMCDQTYRFAPAVAAIRTLIADPAFGPVLNVESTRTNVAHGQPDVDVFWDLAYHDVAILDAVLPGDLPGRCEVRATVQDTVGLGRAHRGRLVLEWATGPCVDVTVDWNAGAKVRVMRFASAEHEIIWEDADGPVLCHDGVPVAVDATEPLAAVVEEFVAAVEHRRPASCGPVHEARVLTLLEAASRSAATDAVAGALP
jgi:predicted dehydrogenase